MGAACASSRHHMIRISSHAVRWTLSRGVPARHALPTPWIRAADAMPTAIVAPDAASPFRNLRRETEPLHFLYVMEINTYLYHLHENSRLWKTLPWRRELHHMQTCLVRWYTPELQSSRPTARHEARGRVYAEGFRPPRTVDASCRGRAGRQPT